jgi:hypothetical protein
VLEAAEFGRYEDRWELLKRPTNEAENWLGEGYAAAIERFGVPPGMPRLPPRT